MSPTTQEKQSYEDNGYLLRKGLVPPAWIADVEREIDCIHERMAEQPATGVGIAWETYDDPDHPPRIKQLMHSEVISATLNRILRCDAMLDIVEDLIGPDISPYHSKLLPKAGGDGTAIPWHQDYAYWKTDDSEAARDMDGDWLQAVRRLVGSAVPIVAIGDPHANLSPRMAEAVDAIIAYRTNPHVDQHKRRRGAARLLVDRDTTRRFP